MTLLHKTVVRKCAKPFGKSSLIVQLEVGDTISIKEPHGKWYTVSLEGLYYQMVKSEVSTQREQAKQAKKNRKDYE